MVNISNNNIITMNRGDSFKLPVTINLGTGVNPIYYDMTENDIIFFAILEPNQPWEQALLKRSFTYDDYQLSGKQVIIELSPEDTESIVPGSYFYQVKLLKTKDPEWRDHESVYTVMPRTRMFILE